MEDIIKLCVSSYSTVPFLSECVLWQGISLDMSEYIK